MTAGKFKFALALLLVASASGQNVNTGSHRTKVLPPPVCSSPPGVGYRWAAYNAANRCNDTAGNVGGVACTTTGDTVDNAADMGVVGGHNAVQGTIAQRPIYQFNAINGKPAWQFTTANQTYMGLQGATISFGTTMTAYAVFKHVAGASGNFLGSGNGGTLGSVEFFDNGTNIQFNSLNRNVILTGTHTLTANSWYTSVLQYNFSTGAAALFLCNTGTCLADGTSTVTGQFFWEMGVIGQSGGTAFLGDVLAEAGFAMNDLTLNAAIFAWSHCQYGI